MLRRSFFPLRFVTPTSIWFCPSASSSSTKHPFDQNAHKFQDTQHQEPVELEFEGNNVSQNENASQRNVHEEALRSETTDQRDQFLRHARRRRQLENTTSKLLYEFHFLKKLCQKRPSMRQWLVRDDVINMNPGNVQLSPSMQSAYMRVVHSKDKATLRQAIRDIVPVILYRQTEKQQPLLPRDNPDSLIPDNQPATLNAKKRELFERRDSISAFQDERLIDARSQNRLRWKIRLRLMRFQKQLAQQNASATRSILYSEQDAVGYFVFRAAPMYAALHRVFFELCKLMPHFVPKSMLDFGSGTGIAILVAKETYDPDGLALPLERDTRRTMNDSKTGVEWNLKELREDLKRMSNVNEQRRKARFVAVASLIAKGELKLTDIPTDLRKEIVNAARIAAARAQERERVDTLNRLKKFVDTHVDWDNDEAIEKRLQEIDLANPSLNPSEDLDQKKEEELLKTDFIGRNETAAGGDQQQQQNSNNNNNDNNNKNWWEQYVEDEYSSKEDAVRRRLRPLQSIVAVEPSPGMVETAMNVLQDDVPNVSYQRYLNPDDATQHDLVVAAYSLSEIATTEEREKTVQELWRRTRGVLILVEYANLPNFNLMMEARDTILAEKEVGLWDWQPTIVGPCPHEKRCPVRHSSLGIKFKSMRVCKTEVQYRPTFVEQWIHRYPKFDVRRKREVEPICYMIFARNEMVPERAERRLEEQRKEQERAKKQRDDAQRDLFKEALKSRDGMYENMSDEALQRPVSGGNKNINDDVDDPSASSVSSTSSSALLAGPASASTNSVLDATNSGGKNQSSDGQLPSLDEQQQQQHDSLSSKMTSENYPVGGMFNIKPGKVEYLEAQSGKVHRITYPNVFPLSTHRYNRAPFVGASHQIQRIITPTEMLVVRREAREMRKKYQHLLHKYWRIVLTVPRLAGKITAHFCTCEGELVRAKIYRRFYGKGTTKAQNDAGSRFPRWQYMGGWRYLKNAQLLSCFPDDLPVYSLLKIEQIDFPNTLLNHKSSVVEQTAMMHNAPINNDAISKIEVDARANNLDPLTAENATLATKSHQRTMTGSTLPPKSSQSNVSPKQQQQQQREDENDDDADSNKRLDFVDSIYQTPSEIMEEVGERTTDRLYGMLNRGQISPSQVDSRSPISGKAWASAIQNARKNTTRQKNRVK